MSIPISVQIDALLSKRVWNLVHRYCGGAWGNLSREWTASFEEIVEEARRRDLQSFVSAKPISEGFWLLENKAGYVVCYFERGMTIYPEEFSDLEGAFRNWLESELKSLQLPTNRAA